jgi:hypothetical protein
LLAGVFEAPPPKGFDAPAVAPPPNNVEPLLGVLVLAVPNMDGVDPPDVLLTAPNNGLLGVLPLPCCPKLKPDMLCGCGGLMRAVWLGSCAGAVYIGWGRRWKRLRNWSQIAQTSNDKQLLRKQICKVQPEND